MFNRVAELEEKVEKLEHKVTELVSDAALGRAVRRAAEKYPYIMFCLFEDEWVVECMVEGELGCGDTPEAALRAAGLMEEEKSK